MSDLQEQESPTPEPAPTPAPTEPAAPVVDAPSLADVAKPVEQPQVQAPAAPPIVEPQQEYQPPQEQSQPAAQPAYQAPQQKTVPQMAQEMNEHDLMFQQDLAQGHIKQKTYHDLYESKSTLGKLGTIFGLLLGGAGSGLTHQPNVLLGMMDKEIERDLAAQKESNSNAQNWYRLNQQYELQKTQQDKMQAENEAIRMGTYKTGIEADKSRAQLNQIGGVDLSASNGAKNQMMLSYTQHQQDVINKMPPGPMRDQAQQALDTQIRPAVLAKIADNNTRTAQKKQLFNTLTGDKPKQPNQQRAATINYDMLNKIDRHNRLMSDNGLTPDVSPESISKFKEESKDLESLRHSREMYDHAFKKLWNMPDKGSLNKSAYAAEVGTLGAQIAKETAGRFNLTEAEKQMEGIFPNYKDFISGAGKEKYENMLRYFDSQESSLTAVNQLKDRYPTLVGPVPKYSSPFEKQQKKDGKKDAAATKEGAEGKDTDGKAIIFKGGKWVYK